MRVGKNYTHSDSMLVIYFFMALCEYWSVAQNLLDHWRTRSKSLLLLCQPTEIKRWLREPFTCWDICDDTLLVNLRILSVVGSTIQRFHKRLTLHTILNCTHIRNRVQLLANTITRQRVSAFRCVDVVKMNSWSSKEHQNANEREFWRLLMW